MTKVGVQPETKFSFTSSDGETVRGAPGEVMVLAGPFEHLELRLTAEEETLPRAVKMVPQLDGAGEEGAEYVLLDVLNTQQCRTARLGLKFPVETGQTEAVPAGGEQKSPRSSDDARWEIVSQQRDELLRQHLGLPLHLGHHVQVQAEGLVGDGGLGLVRDVSHHLAVTARSPHQTGESGQPGGHGRVQCSVFSVQYHRESTQPSLPQLGGVAHGRQTERRNEIILYELSESRNFLIFFLHYLDVLSELYDSLAVRLIMLFPASCLAASMRPWWGGLSNADKIAAKAARPLSTVNGAAYMSPCLKLL